VSAWELVSTCVAYLAFSILAAYAVAYLCSRRRRRLDLLAGFDEILERVQSELETDRQQILREVRGERP
jgi:hypothetical protein